MHAQHLDGKTEKRIRADCDLEKSMTTHGSKKYVL
jgi:hypothetical protein